MRVRVSKRDLLRRIEALENRLTQPTPAPLPGQQAIPVATISDHFYMGPSLWCRADLFGTICGAHRDAHQFIDENDLKEQR
ncbi:hypothetical protein [Streptomyces sp. AD55]|uniref:hypothetical protein n=1 Tax=Streptomyces sp. AD55 TaxID=3242895 RepID=UPI003527D714